MRKCRHAVGSVKYLRSRGVGAAPASAGGCLMWWWSGEDDAINLTPRARPVSVARAGPGSQSERNGDASLAEPGGAPHPAPEDPVV